MFEKIIDGTTIAKVLKAWVLIVLAFAMFLPFSLFYFPIAIVLGIAALVLFTVTRHQKIAKEASFAAEQQRQIDFRKEEWLSGTRQLSIKSGILRERLDLYCRNRFQRGAIWWLKVPGTNLLEAMTLSDSVLFYGQGTGKKPVLLRAVITDGIVLITEVQTMVKPTPIQPPISRLPEQDLLPSSPTPKEVMPEQATPKEPVPEKAAAKEVEPEQLVEKDEKFKAYAKSWVAMYAPGYLQEAGDAGLSVFVIQKGEYPKTLDSHYIADALRSQFHVEATAGRDIVTVQGFDQEPRADSGESNTYQEYPEYTAPEADEMDPGASYDDSGIPS